MRSLIVTAIFVVLLAVGSLLPTGTHTIGTIEALDPETRVLKLDDGSTFTLAKKIDQETLAVGTKVRIGYNSAASGNTVRSIRQVN